MKTIKWYNIIFIIIFVISTVYLIENLIILSIKLKTLTTIGTILIGLALIAIILTGDWLIEEYKSYLKKYKIPYINLHILKKYKNRD